MMDENSFYGKKICVAVSGGMDSMSLLHYLLFQKEKGGYQLCAVHCEHGIRGKDSLEDAQFVKQICENWGVPCFFFSEDCPRLAKEKKMSLETAARVFRHACFSQVLAEGKADFVATAHHQGDEAETVLFRIARGTSLSGVCGISKIDGKDGKLIRPFLDWTRADIEKYAHQNQIFYREDKTNFDIVYTRNKIRLEVLPKLEEAVPSAAENIVKFAHRAAEDDALLYSLCENLLSQSEEGFWQVRLDERKPLFTRACLMALKRMGLEKDYTELHLSALYNLQFLSRGAKSILPKNIHAKKTENAIVFFHPTAEGFERKNAGELFENCQFDGGRYEVSVFFTPPSVERVEGRILKIDMNCLPKNAVFRFREEGDEIERFGGGRKTLKKFFNEEKIAVEERAYLPLIAEKDGKEIYVVCGVEISEKVKISEKTQRIAYIVLQKKKGE